MRSFLARLPPRARGAVSLCAWLGCTAAQIAVLADPGTAIDTDEVYWIGSTHYYHLAFEARDWNHPDWNLIPARENPPAAKYVLGAGLAIQGFHIASLDLVGSFYAYFDANLGRPPGFPERAAKQDSVLGRMMPQLRRLVSQSRQMYIAPELLRAGRRVVLVCGVLTSLFVFLLGTSIAGAATGLLASQLFLLHPSVIGAYRHAMSDAPAFMFGTAAALATWLFTRRFVHGDGKELGQAAMVGALIGLAVAAKLNWVIIAFLFGVVTAYLAVQAWRRNDRGLAVRTCGAGMIGLGASLAVFILINPSIVGDPVHELMTPVRELRLAAQIQAAVLPQPPSLSTAGAKLSAVTSLVLWKPWTFALALVAVAVACVRSPRPGIWFVATWWLIAFVLVTAWIPFEWARYVLPLTIPSVLLAAHAVVVSASALTRRSAT